MADSTVLDVTKMKVVELRKELKSRGLSYTGDKAELIARLQAAVVQDDHGEITLDSDENVELDSDGVLEDEDDKSHNDILEDSTVDTLHEDMVLNDKPDEDKTSGTGKTQRLLKRKINVTETETDKNDDTKRNDKDSSKKIILKRAVSATKSSKPEVLAQTLDETQETGESEKNKTKISIDTDLQKKLELRAKRFGVPIKMSEEERKEARKQRFGQTTGASVRNTTSLTLSENLDKLKQRAERFGQSVSKIMTDIENKEKLEKRKAKFGMAK